MLEIDFEIVKQIIVFLSPTPEGEGARSMINSHYDMIDLTPKVMKIDLLVPCIEGIEI
jgi:hypothetical protein